MNLHCQVKDGCIKTDDTIVQLEQIAQKGFQSGKENKGVKPTNSNNNRDGSQ